MRKPETAPPTVVGCPARTNAKVDFEIEVPGDLARLHLPEGLDRRLQMLLDKQDGGTALRADEQAEAEGWSIC